MSSRSRASCRCRKPPLLTLPRKPRSQTAARVCPRRFLPAGSRQKLPFVDSNGMVHHFYLASSLCMRVKPIDHATAYETVFRLERVVGATHIAHPRGRRFPRPPAQTHAALIRKLSSKHVTERRGFELSGAKRHSKRVFGILENALCHQRLVYIFLSRGL